MKIITLLFAAALSCSAGTIYTVAWEDHPGQFPQSDRDMNEGVFKVLGLLFASTGIWIQPSPAINPGERPFPFPTANYFDHAVATGNVITTFLFSESAWSDTPYIKVGANGIWTAITGTLTLSATVGDLVYFRLDTPYGTRYPSAADNPDGLSAAVFAESPEDDPTPRGNTPEPVSSLLIGAGLCVIARMRTRKKSKLSN